MWAQVAVAAAVVDTSKRTVVLHDRILVAVMVVAADRAPDFQASVRSAHKWAHVRIKVFKVVHQWVALAKRAQAPA
jgi:hypothetical protein